MSNRAYLSRTKFEGDDGELSWGWRMGDDFLRSFDDSFGDKEVPTDPLELLAKAADEGTSEERDLFESLLNNGKGILINGSWHEFEEIAPVLRKAVGKEG